AVAVGDDGGHGPGLVHDVVFFQLNRSGPRPTLDVLDDFDFLPARGLGQLAAAVGAEARLGGVGRIAGRTAHGRFSHFGGLRPACSMYHVGPVGSSGGAGKTRFALFTGRRDV